MKYRGGCSCQGGRPDEDLGGGGGGMTWARSRSGGKAGVGGRGGRRAEEHGATPGAGQGPDAGLCTCGRSRALTQCGGMSLDGLRRKRDVIRFLFSQDHGCLVKCKCRPAQGHRTQGALDRVTAVETGRSPGARAIPGRAGSTRGSSSRFPDQLMLLPRPGRPTLTHLPGPADTSRPLSGLRGPTPARRRAHSLLAPSTLEAPPCALSTTGCSHLFTRLSLSLDYELQGAHCLLPETTRRHTQNCSNTPGGAHGPGAGRPRRCGCHGRPSRRAQRQRLLPERSPCCPLCSLGTSAEWESSPETGGVGRLR